MTSRWPASWAAWRRKSPPTRRYCSSRPTSKRRAFAAAPPPSDCAPKPAPASRNRSIPPIPCWPFSVSCDSRGGIPQLGAGQPISDCFPQPAKAISVDIDPRFRSPLHGPRRPSNEEMTRILTAIGFDGRRRGRQAAVSVPSFRATKDIGIEADIIEEIARNVGLRQHRLALPDVTVRHFAANAQHVGRADTSARVVPGARLREFTCTSGTTTSGCAIGLYPHRTASPCATRRHQAGNAAHRAAARVAGRPEPQSHATGSLQVDARSEASLRAEMTWRISSGISG
jgi:hypothetical protein